MTTEPQLVRVADGVHAWIGAGGDSNAGAIETPQGSLVIDTQQYPRLARQFREALEASTGKPVHSVVNTHCHLDHTAGHIVFADVPILAHDKTLAAMQKNLGQRSGDYWEIADFPPKSGCCSDKAFSSSFPKAIRHRAGLGSALACLITTTAN